LNVLEFENDGSRLRLERSMALVSEPGYVFMPTGDMSQARQAGLPACPASATAVAAAASTAAEDTAEAEKTGHIVTSPVVGIFYAAPSPDSDPFVKRGSQVEVGSPLCIIEAMKLMNEVTSAWDGTVLEIMAENGQRVEYGQPLMRIGGN